MIEDAADVKGQLIEVGKKWCSAVVGGLVLLSIR